MKYQVAILEDFEVEIPLGPLVVKGLDGETVRTVAGPRVFVSKNVGGTVGTFANKKAAEAFCAVHGAKVRYLGPPPKRPRPKS